MTADASTTVKEFKQAVNMTAKRLSTWLNSDESKQVGQKRGGKGEATGHASGRKIVTLLGKKSADLTTADLAHMRKVVGYVKRHTARRPGGDVSDTPWRYSLMNLGHDPVKKRATRLP